MRNRYRSRNKGNGSIKCAICFKPLAQHSTFPCPNSGFTITDAARKKRDEQMGRGTVGA